MLPNVSISIPTLNAEKTIRQCLESILAQDYPQDKIEIVIADGGSTDETLKVITSINATNSINLRVLHNPLKTGEAGKAAGVKAANGEITALIDSDNILPSQDWLKRMVEPFSDPEIIASEPIEYTYRKTDAFITRYCALIGMNDPLCLFLGNYDRYSHITGRWTSMPHKEEDKGDYLKVELDYRHIPTIGANGFLIRKGALDKFDIGDYLFDIDVLCSLSAGRHKLKIAKVKIGIIHVFAGDFLNFIRKQKRRINDYRYYKKMGLRKYEWSKIGFFGIIKFITYTVLLVPLILQMLKGYARKRDVAWLFHLPACLATLVVYSFSSIQGFFVSRPLDRSRWRQS